VRTINIKIAAVVLSAFAMLSTVFGGLVAVRGQKRLHLLLGIGDAIATRRAMQELVEKIAKALVDNPDQVQVHAIEGEQVTVFELRVHASDLGKVIGRHGRTAQAIRTILSAVGMKFRERFTREILD
jgi:uncharacterized protein